MANGSAIDQTTGNLHSDPSGVLASALEPFTRSLFKEAGLESGMHVLDLCSGAGDVAFLAREVVGDAGKIVGFDTAPGLVGYANERAAHRNLKNVEFIESNFENISFPDQFDAVVGRLVLMNRQDPATDLRAVFRFVRPGGLVMLQELDLLAAQTVPIAREIDRTREWIRDVANIAGVDPQMGPKLHPTLLAAGLINIQMRVDSLIGGAETFLPTLLSEVAATLAPLHPMVGTAQTEGLEQRMRADLKKSGGVMSTAQLISAWARIRC
jgi:SAM-dependent methyltransferase